MTDKVENQIRALLIYELNELVKYETLLSLETKPLVHVKITKPIIVISPAITWPNFSGSTRIYDKFTLQIINERYSYYSLEYQRGTVAKIVTICNHDLPNLLKVVDRIRFIQEFCKSKQQARVDKIKRYESSKRYQKALMRLESEITLKSLKAL